MIFLVTRFSVRPLPCYEFIIYISLQTSFVITETICKHFRCNPSLPQQDLIFCYRGNNRVRGNCGLEMGKLPATVQWPLLERLIICSHLLLPEVACLAVISPVC